MSSVMSLRPRLASTIWMVPQMSAAESSSVPSTSNRYTGKAGINVALPERAASNNRIFVRPDRIGLESPQQFFSLCVHLLGWDRDRAARAIRLQPLLRFAEPKALGFRLVEMLVVPLLVLQDIFQIRHSQILRPAAGRLRAYREPAAEAPA